MPNYQKRIVYLSEEQRLELFSKGTITVNGNTITYSANDMYVTPQEEPYVKPADGIPAEDLADGVVPVQDVQVNGTSAVDANGVANIPIGKNQLGVLRVDSSPSYGLMATASGILTIYPAVSSDIKAGTAYAIPISVAKQHEAVFYGLAKAAGDTTQSASSNAVGTYTAEAKAAIQQMLGIDLSSIAAEVEIPLVETVSGTTPSITGQPNIRYNCGEVTTISITPPASGSIDVYFESGSTAAVLTVPNTVKWPSWFDATTLEANTTYEILITDGVYGSVMTWAT